MRLLVTGGSGDLGRPLTRLATTHTEHITSTYFTNSNTGGGNPTQLDLCNREDVLSLVSQVQPTVIIHAAISDRSHDMSNAHRLAAEHVAEAANAVGARLIVLSSDMVFDGTNAPYAEESRPTPTSEYGQAKHEVEKYLIEAAPTCLIVRTSLIYEFARENRQVSWMLDRIDAGDSVPLFQDEYRQPIHATNLAECLLELASSSVGGIIHVAGPNSISRLEYGSALLTTMGYNPSNLVEPVLASEIAPLRPRDLSMTLDKARKHLRTPLLTIQEATTRFPLHGHRTETTTSR